MRSKHFTRWTVAAAASACLTISGPPPALATTDDGSHAPQATPAEAAAPQRHLFVTSIVEPLIGVGSVSRSGEISPVPGSPFDTGFFSLGIAIAPDGETVYVTHTVSGTLVGFHVNKDGSLVELPTAQDRGPGPAVGVAVTPDGKRLFATLGMGPIEVRSYDIAEDGSFAPTGAPPVRLPLGTFSQVSIMPDGRHLVVSSWGEDSIRSFHIDKDGSLTEVGQALPTGRKPVMPVFTPDGRYVYVADELSFTISGYAVDRDGSLTELPASPFPAGLNHGAAVSNDGRHLYTNSVNPDSSGVLGYAIRTDGSLDPLPGGPVPAGNGRIVMAPDSKQLLVLDGQGGVDVLDRAANGRLTPADVPTGDAGVKGSDGQSAVITPNQGPVARIVLQSRTERGVVLSAARAVDPDGVIDRYVWTVNNGRRKVTTQPTLRLGPTDRVRRVRVRVVDDEGCSSRLIYTGVAASCVGSRRAIAKISLTR